MMMRTSIKDLKNNLSAYIKRIRCGEELIITFHNHAVAKLVPLTGELPIIKPDRKLFLNKFNNCMTNSAR